MLNRITIHNFQSHKDTIIDLASVTVLYGLSDSGKSAVRKALQCIVNKSPFYLRTADNVNDGRIILEFDNYKIERYVKVKKLRKCPNCKSDINGEHICPSCATVIPVQFSKDVYIINDKDEYERFGLELPDHIQKELGFAVEKFDTKSVNYNIMSQFDDMFFIGRTYDSIRNKMINLLVPDSDIIGQTIQNFKEEKNRLVADVRTYTTLVDEIDTKIANFNKEKFDKASVFIEKMEKAESDLISKKQKFSEISTVKSELQTLELVDVDVEKYGKYIDNFKVCYEKIRQNKNTLKNLKDVKEMIDVPKINADKITTAGKILEYVNFFDKQLEDTKNKMSEILKIRSILNEIDNCDKELGVSIENAKLAYENAKKRYFKEHESVICPFTNTKCSILNKA